MAKLLSPKAIAIFLVILTVCVIGVVAYLLWPHSPQVQINSLSLSPLGNSNSDPFTAVWNITFDIQNPNRWSLEYKGVTVSIYYEHFYEGYNEHVLLSSSVADQQSSFHQSKKSLTTYGTSVVVQNNVEERIKEDWMRGVHTFSILMHGKYLYRPLSVSWTLHNTMVVSCKNVEIGFDPINKFGIKGSPKKCAIII